MAPSKVYRFSLYIQRNKFKFPFILRYKGKPQKKIIFLMTMPIRPYPPSHLEFNGSLKEPVANEPVY